MSNHITLPPVATDILEGRGAAIQITSDLNAAYWMYGQNNSTALFLLEKAHDAFAHLADALGYTITPKVTPKVTPESLRAEHSTICEAMNRGTWPGSEADALARINAIPAEIAKLEAAA